ncbi:MAG: alanine racemase [Eubacteriales bacterium]|nr:alanine racemase [Eubacteriales bacterium]
MTYSREKSRTWVEVSRSRLLYNLRAIRKQVPASAKFCVVVKADAYGHGAEFVAGVAEAYGLADFFAVANLDEAERLRQAGIKLPILIMSHVAVEEVEQLLDLNLRPTIASLREARAYAEALKKLGKSLKVHLKLDTGMARLGILCHEKEKQAVLDELSAIGELPEIEIEGIFSHFASAGSDPEYQKLQYARFIGICNGLAERGLEIPIRHIANSSTIVNHPEMSLDMVRAGIIVYGSYESYLDYRILPLKPVMDYQSRISEIRQIEAGETVGYGRTWTAERATTLAVIEAGYSDGLPRSLSNCGVVSIRGQHCPIVGRVCMDRSMLDVTDLPEVRIGDIAHLFGGAEPDFISADEQAALAGTISYELFCNVNRRVPRIYVD